MKVVKKAKKTFKKATKACGLTGMQSRRLKKTVKAMSYDVAVNVGTTIVLDIIYTAADAAATGACLVASKVAGLIPSKKDVTAIEEDMAEATEDSEA